MPTKKLLPPLLYLLCVIGCTPSSGPPPSPTPGPSTPGPSSTAPGSTVVPGSLSSFSAITAGLNHTCGLTGQPLNTASAAVKCWGDNERGALGDGSFTNRLTPVDVVGLGAGVTAISAGGYHTCAITTTNALFCWGDNGFGQLGDGTRTQRNVPGAAVTSASLVAAGYNHTCGVLPNLGIACWGDNAAGQASGAGSSSGGPILRPQRVVGIPPLGGATFLGAGRGDSCVVLDGPGGTVNTTASHPFCWGYPVYGELGNGVMSGPGATSAVAWNYAPVYQLAVGYDHACVLILNPGRIKCWGLNATGQLGDGTKTNRGMPVDVIGLTGQPARIAAGRSHTCALMSFNDPVQCWGANDHGQLGADWPNAHDTPVSTGLTNVLDIVAGSDHTCALLFTGVVRCWGNNDHGQLGDGTTTDRHVP